MVLELSRIIAEAEALPCGKRRMWRSSGDGLFGTRTGRLQKGCMYKISEIYSGSTSVRNSLQKMEKSTRAPAYPLKSVNYRV